MSALFPDRPPQELWSPDFEITLSLQMLADLVFEGAVNIEAARPPKHHSRGVFVEKKQRLPLSYGAMVIFVEHVILLFEPWMLGSCGEEDVIEC
jgi:hypothetical protein